LFIVYHYTSH